VKIAYLAPEIPALSATFVYNEILQLEKLGNEVSAFSVHRPGAEVTDPSVDKLKENVIHLYEYSIVKVLLTHIFLLFSTPLTYLKTLALLVKDIFRLGLLSRGSLGQVYRFLFSGRLAYDLKKLGCQHVHTHFAHVPTDIAMYAAALSDIPYSVTAHANDLFERGYLLQEKVQRSSFFATISEYNIRMLERIACNKEQLKLIRCGVDAEKFSSRQDFVPNSTFKVGVIGRLVEKKGIDTLIKAFSLLKEQGIKVSLSIAGSGPLDGELKAFVQEEGLGDNRVTFLGAIPHTQVAQFVESLDIFVLPCKQDKNGDMDGIPVVLMEAMLSGVPVISTSISGIPELVINNETGLLVAPNDEGELASAIKVMMDEAANRKNMTAKGITKVNSDFSLQGNTAKLNSLFKSVALTQKGKYSRV